jgi:hypothetical protein
MRKVLVRTGPLLGAILLGCAGGAKWSATCGCAPIGAALMLEIPLHLVNGEDFTPEAMRAWFSQHFSGNRVSLEDLRALGPLSNHWCSARPLGGLTCVYWLWERDGGQLRGIEVTLSENRPSDVQARYVFDHRR